MSNNSFLYFIFIASSLSMLNNSLVQSPFIKTLIYGIMVLFEIKLFFFCKRNKFCGYRMGNVIVPLFFIMISFAHSNYEPLWGLYIKYLGYVLCFIYGGIIWYKDNIIIVNKKLLYITILSPLFLVGLFDHTPHKTIFYTLSNVYSFAGLCFGFYYYTVLYNKDNILRNSLFLILLYILSSSTLGILVAFILSFVYISRRNIKMIICCLLLFIVISILVLYTEIPVFARVKDVISVFGNMTKDDWYNIRDLNMWDISKDVDYSSDRTDNTSAIWRLSHWVALIQDFLKYYYYSFIIGLGDSYTKEVLGNVPHNDYLRFLCEYGLVVFGYIIYYMRHLLKTIKNDEVLIFIAAFLFYSISENLINTFASNAIMYFCIGYHYERCKNDITKPLNFRTLVLSR